MLEALKITKKSFNKYLDMPLREEEGRLNYDQAKGYYLIRDPQDTDNWRCVSKEYFDKTYEFFVSAHPTQFRMLITKETQDGDTVRA